MVKNIPTALLAEKHKTLDPPPSLSTRIHAHKSNKPCVSLSGLGERERDSESEREVWVRERERKRERF